MYSPCPTTPWPSGRHPSVFCPNIKDRCLAHLSSSGFSSSVESPSDPFFFKISFGAVAAFGMGHQPLDGHWLAVVQRSRLLMVDHMSRQSKSGSCITTRSCITLSLVHKSCIFAVQCLSCGIIIVTRSLLSAVSVTGMRSYDAPLLCERNFYCWLLRQVGRMFVINFT